jgi:hypothetical protein
MANATQNSSQRTRTLWNYISANHGPSQFRISCSSHATISQCHIPCLFALFNKSSAFLTFSSHSSNFFFASSYFSLAFSHSFCASTCSRVACSTLLGMSSTNLKLWSHEGSQLFQLLLKLAQSKKAGVSYIRGRARPRRWGRMAPRSYMLRFVKQRRRERSLLKLSRSDGRCCRGMCGVQDSMHDDMQVSRSLTKIRWKTKRLMLKD